MRDPNRLRSVRGDLVEALGGTNTRLLDWQQNSGKFFNAIKVEQNVMFLILMIIVIVAAFNIISGLIMLVKDKGQGIAILRTMGATRGMVMRIFFLSGASVGVVGTLLGLGLGIGIATNIEHVRQAVQQMTQLPVAFSLRSCCR